MADLIWICLLVALTAGMANWVREVVLVKVEGLLAATGITVFSIMTYKLTERRRLTPSHRLLERPMLQHDGCCLPVSSLSPPALLLLLRTDGQLVLEHHDAGTRFVRS